MAHMGIQRCEGSSEKRLLMREPVLVTVLCKCTAATPAPNALVSFEDVDVFPNGCNA